jgi:hypothetical protein
MQFVYCEHHNGWCYTLLSRYPAVFWLKFRFLLIFSGRIDGAVAWPTIFGQGDQLWGCDFAKTP